mgnify:CR=1 FL=1
MFRLLSLLVVSVLLVTTPNRAMAGDEDDVKAAVVAMFTALETWDTDGWVDAHTEDCTIFAGGTLGAMLVPADMDREALRASNEEARLAGTAPVSIQVQYMDVNVMGNIAYTTGYLIFAPVPDATVPPSRWRSTMIWVKQGGKWKRAHYHSSPLYPGQ